MTRTQDYALSIKQPWATLLVHGLKTIEVRRWSTRRRGRILIHAGSVMDRRPEGWAQLPPHLQEIARQQRGGIVGAAELTDCLVYRTPEAFTVDCLRHLNDPSWFQEPRLYGFVFAKEVVLPFRRRKGNLFFFPVEDETTAPKGPPA